MSSTSTFQRRALHASAYGLTSERQPLPEHSVMMRFFVLIWDVRRAMRTFAQTRPLSIEGGKELDVFGDLAIPMADLGTTLRMSTTLLHEQGTPNGKEGSWNVEKLPPPHANCPRTTRVTFKAGWMLVTRAFTPFHPGKSAIMLASHISR